MVSCDGLLEVGWSAAAWLAVAVALGIPMGLRMHADTAADEDMRPANWALVAIAYAVGIGWFAYIAADAGSRCESVWAGFFFAAFPLVLVAGIVALGATLRSRRDSS